jgi:hypothetical protein
VPTEVSVQTESRATPEASVTTGTAVPDVVAPLPSVLSPLATLNVTVTPGTGLLNASVASTAGNVGTAWPKRAPVVVNAPLCASAAAGPAFTVTVGCCAIVVAALICALTMRTPDVVDARVPVTTPLAFVTAAGCVIVMAAPLATASVTVAPATGAPPASFTVTVIVAGPPPAENVAGDATTVDCEALDAPPNDAVAVFDDVMLRAQVAPAQSPLQPSNVEPADAVPVSVTDVPSSRSRVQTPLVTPAPMEHEIPAGALVTVPAPAPPPEIVSVRTAVNVA